MIGYMCMSESKGGEEEDRDKRCKDAMECSSYKKKEGELNWGKCVVGKQEGWGSYFLCFE